jgi:hypothetical protein
MSEYYTEIGRWIVWLTCIGFFVLCLSVAAVMFDSWVLKPRREFARRAAWIEAAQAITRDSYWFSEHPPTAFLIRELAKVYLEGQGSTIGQIRDNWRREMSKP